MVSSSTMLLVITMILSMLPSASSQSIRVPLYRNEVATVKPTSMRRYRQLLDGSYELVPLNIGTGTHYTWIYIGTPPQRASIIVDTGSHLLAMVCATCHECGHHTDPAFDPKQSSTVSSVSCQAERDLSCHSCGSEDKCVLSQSYTEGSSWTAQVLEDQVWLGNATESKSSIAQLSQDFGVRMKFGCQYKLTGMFKGQVSNGIMGMANFDFTLLPHLFSNKKIQHKIFSLCFSRKGGSMVLGAPETFKHTAPIAYTKYYVQHSGWYSVNIKDTKIGGISIGAEEHEYQRGKGFIIDSGTTDSYFPRGIANKFKKSFKERTGREYMSSTSSCSNGWSKEDLNNLPSIEIVLEGLKGQPNLVLNIPATQYMDKNSNGKYCGSLYLSEEAGGVIGANLMRNYDVVFDTDKHHVGFARANCDFKAPTNAPTEQKKTEPTEIPSPSTASTETTIIAITENPTEAPTENTTEVSTENPLEASTENTTEVSTENPLEASTENPTEVSTENPLEASTENPTEAPTENTTEVSTENPTEAPTENTTEVSTENPLEVSTDNPTEAPSENPAEAPTEISTEAPTEKSKETPSEAPTEAPTDSPTQTPIKVPTADTTKIPTTIRPVENLDVNGNNSSKTGGDNEDGENPVLLTAVGVTIASLFILCCIIRTCCWRNKKAKKGKWSRLEVDEEELAGEDGVSLVQSSSLGSQYDSSSGDDRPLAYRDNIEDNEDDFLDDDEDLFVANSLSSSHNRTDLDRL